MEILLSEVKVQLPQSGKLLFEIQKLKIQSGEKILIKGQSGKGKTTLLHLIAGLLQPAAGEVLVGGQALVSLSDSQRSKFRREHMGIVFQNLNLIEHLTAQENVELALSRERSHIKVVEEALVSVGLKEKLLDKTSVLSLGEQQRVAVARVVARAPDLILADEPTSSLDEKNAIAVMDLLITAAKAKTLIVVSHDHRIEKKFSKILKFEELIST